MTMPVALAPSAGAAVTAPGGGSGAPGGSAGAEGFGALVAAALAVTPGAAALLPTATVAGATLPGEAQEGVSDAPEGSSEEASEGATAAGDLAAQLLGVVVPVALMSPAAPQGATQATPIAVQLDVEGQPATGPLTVEPAPAAAAEHGTSELPAATALAPEGQSARSGGDSASAVPAANLGTTTTAAATDVPVPQAVATVEGPRLAQAPGADAPTTTGPVARQTFPEVTRLVTRGDGTHRLTIQLRPEGLGDVRVVLTMRAGKVDVRLTASSAARDALASDLPQLHRLLAAAGATETSVSLRDTQQLLSSAFDAGQRGMDRSAAPSSSGDLTGQAGGGTGQSRQREENPQQARMTADQIATDGVRDRAAASGPNDPATGVRAAGLDVTV